MFKKLTSFFRKIYSNESRTQTPDLDSKALNHILIENAEVGMYIIQDNQFKYFNKKMCELYGYTFNEVVEKLSPDDLVHPEDKELVKNNIAARLKRQKKSLEYEFRTLKKDGSYFWIKVNGSTIIYNGKEAIYGVATDITEQKKLEDSKRHSDEILRLIVDAAQLGTWVWHLKDDLWFPSSTYYTMLGYKPIKGATDANFWHNRVHPDDLDKIINKIKQVKQNTIDHYQYEARMLHADGSYRWHQVIGHAIEKDKDGKVLKMAGIRKDVTNYKQAVYNFKESEGKLKALINTIPDLIWLKDPNGVFLQCNKRISELYGTDIKNIIGKTDYDFVDKNTADFFRQKDEEARIKGHPSINEEKVTFADGHQEVLETIKTPVFSNDGTFIGVLGIGRDITERKNAETQIKENEELLRSIIKLAPYPVSLTDMEGRFVLVNDAYTKLNKANSNEVIGKTPKQLGFKVDDETQVYIEKEMREKGKVENYELKATLMDGSIADFLYSTTLVRWKNKPYILHNSVNITEQKETELELKKYRKHLEEMVQERTEELEASMEELHVINDELNEQKAELQQTINALNNTRDRLIQAEKMASLGVLSAGIAHEINNPLNFIHGGSMALKKYFEKNEHYNIKEITPLLNAINEGVSRTSKIVNSLSHYSRKDDLPMTQCDLHEVIDNCLVMLQNKLKSKVEIIKKYHPKNLIITGNEGKLHQAILNIIANAEQAIETDGKIEIKTALTKGYAIISITDSGSGIPTEIMDKIFDPFFTTKPTGEGTGLGLSITYNIIKEHHGEINFNSINAKGTTFRIELPIKSSKND